MKTASCTGRFMTCCALIARAGCLFLPKGFWLLFLSFALLHVGAEAQDHFIPERELAPFAYEEIPVRVVAEGYKIFYVNAVYANNKLLYVNIKDLFATLGIPCITGQKGNSLEGFIDPGSRPYRVDFTLKQIINGDKTVECKNALVKEMGNLYLECSLFAEAFGISTTFNYRAICIFLKADFELPAMKQIRIEKMRDNVSKLKGEEMADTVVKRDYHLFRFGTLDWAAASIQTWKGATNNHFGLGLGTELLYGEADITVNYYDQYKFNDRQLQYIWRWVDNDKKVIKQAQAGKISTQTISYIAAPVIGAVIRNSPTTLRKAKGYYTINEKTEPNWTVELYINNVLVDFTKADASGSFLFKVPIVYGYTILKLKFYSPTGEERTEERTMNVPYTVMPAGGFEYGLASGMVQDTSRSRFGRGEFNYGVSRMLTIGGGLEYLSSITNGAYIPFAMATIQPYTKLTLSGEYAHGVRTRSLLNYYFRKDVLLELDYTKYVNGQMATRFNAPEERKAKLSVPFRYKKINGFAKFDFTQLIYKAFSYNQAYITISAYYKQFSANSATQFNWIGRNQAYVTTDLALSYRLNKGYTVRPSAQYNISRNRFVTCKVAVEKSIPKGNIFVSYERNVLSGANLVSLSFRYDLSFARTNITATQINSMYAISESAQGSLAFGSGNKFIYITNNSTMSKGGISLYPFLDLNNNGLFDLGEHLVKVNDVRTFGGKVILSEKDSILRITDMNAFVNYLVEFKDNDLENIAWRFKYKSYQVLVDPNQFKRIDVPVVSVGEVSGMTYMGSDNALKGIGRISVKIYRKNDPKVVAEILSESDGYIYYLGLEPGEYLARLDSAQLQDLGFSVKPAQRAFTIRTSEAGDMAGGIDFVMRSAQQDSLDEQNREAIKMELAQQAEEKSLLLQPLKRLNLKKTTLLDKQENMQPLPMPHLAEQVSVVRDSIVYVPGDTLYKVQLLALRKPLKSKAYFAQLLADVPGLTIEETLGEDGLYHYSTRAFKGIAESREFQRIIKKSGWKDSFVAIYVGENRGELAFRLKLGKQGSQTGKKIPSRMILPAAKEKETVKTEVSPPQQHILPLDGQKIAVPDPAVHGIAFERDTLSGIRGETLYKVQLLALRVPIRVKGYFVRLLTAVPGLTIEELEGADGFYHYSTGAFRSMSEAEEFLQLIRQSGWNTCFLSTYVAAKQGDPVFRLRHGK